MTLESLSVAGAELSRYDVVIPYADASLTHEDLELALDSLEGNAIGLRFVWLVTANPKFPPKLRNRVNFVYGKDTYEHCKDANLILKTLYALWAGAGRVSKTEEIPIVWMSDDNVLLKPTNLAKFPLVYNDRKRDDFPPSCVWHKRMRKTFDELKKIGKPLVYNFDAHCPLCLTRKEWLEAIEKAPWDRNVCIHTWCVGYCRGEKAMEGAVEQTMVKVNFEEKDGKIPQGDFTFVGYNDKGRELAHQYSRRFVPRIEK